MKARLLLCAVVMEVQRLFQDDIIEIDTVFYAPQKK